MKRKIFKVIKVIVVIGIIAVIFLLLTNAYMINSQSVRIYDINAVSEIKDDYDCIIVLGAGVRADGSPSNMLEDRLLTGIKLYNVGLAPKLIMSGDHGSIHYDEVNTMKSFALEKGVKSSDVFMDHAGFSTYDTMYRAKEVFRVDKAVIVTQKYHLYRALYIAEKMGIECVGVSADLRYYRGEVYREARELFARTKDFISSAVKPKPKYLGDVITVSGNGDETNDK